jgi:hypothetical protein
MDVSTFHETYPDFRLDEAVDSINFRCNSEDRAWRVLGLLEDRVLLRRLSIRKKDVPRFFWRLVAHEWANCDVLPHEVFARKFAEFRAAWEPQCMSLYELRRFRHESQYNNLAIYNGLPDNLTVYRGQHRSDEPGLAWTTDRKTAGAFARGHRCIYNSQPVILKTTIAKSEVAFVVFDREESEVVLFKPPSLTLCTKSTRGIPPRH